MYVSHVLHADGNCTPDTTSALSFPDSAGRPPSAPHPDPRRRRPAPTTQGPLLSQRRGRGSLLARHAESPPSGASRAGPAFNSEATLPRGAVRLSAASGFWGFSASEVRSQGALRQRGQARRLVGARESVGRLSAERRGRAGSRPGSGSAGTGGPTQCKRRGRASRLPAAKHPPCSPRGLRRPRHAVPRLFGRCAADEQAAGEVGSPVSPGCPGPSGAAAARPRGSLVRCVRARVGLTPGSVQLLAGIVARGRSARLLFLAPSGFGAAAGGAGSRGFTFPSSR